MNALADLPSAAQAEDHARRFGGMARLYGAAGAAQIAASHVVVVGIGGVGSWTAEALARSGVGRITLIDLDHVALSNVNRQLHAADTTLGLAKVQAMSERIASFAPACQVHAVDAFVDAATWPALLHDLPRPDALVDACDQAQAKQVLARWALAQRGLGLRFITVGAAGGKRLAHAVEVDDIARATHDPVLARLRATLRRDARHSAALPVPAYRSSKPPKVEPTLGVTAVFSRESVANPQRGGADACDARIDGSLNCAGYGSMVSVTATFGLCAAGWVINQLAAPEKRPKTEL